MVETDKPITTFIRKYKESKIVKNFLKNKYSFTVLKWIDFNYYYNTSFNDCGISVNISKRRNGLKYGQMIFTKDSKQSKRYRLVILTGGAGIHLSHCIQKLAQDGLQT